MIVCVSLQQTGDLSSCISPYGKTKPSDKQMKNKIADIGKIRGEYWLLLTFN